MPIHLPETIVPHPSLARSLIVVLAISALGLAGCDRTPPLSPPPSPPTTAASGDSYDPSKMDFKPGAAKLSTERHTGPFAAGSALSLDATLKPLVPDTVKEIRLDTTHKVIEIAPGVKFSAWTFGDQVPGPDRPGARR